MLYTQYLLLIESGRVDTVQSKHRRKMLQAGVSASETSQRGVHKLMRSGTLLGKLVKKFYQAIWDFTYR